ncbi:MAG TPA: hypothetical protein VN281_21925 [Verrucomicrobiae bacterium]|nr:hypothetical protein [Verrucomicrobiae bacterium]
MCCRVAALAFIFGAVHASAQTTRTWNGSISSDWFNPTNWIPAGVPATNDIVNVTNGTVNLTAPVTIAGQLNWSAGTFTGNPMTIASNGVMNANCTATLFLENALTNAGTITLSNNSGTLWVINNNGVPYAGLIENLPGALFDIQNDQTMLNDAGATAYFHNAGTLRKSGTTGATYISIPLINSGSVTGLQGTLTFNGGGTLAGTYTAAGGAAIYFSGGYFTNSSSVAINGPGTVQLVGNGNLTLLADAIANLALAGGTVYLGPAFQGGTITNLTISGATLAGTNTVSGTLNYSNGVVAGGPLTVAGHGVLNINGSSGLSLESPLTNSGTVTWSGSGSVDVLNNNGLPYAGLIENLGGAVFDIQCDQILENNAGTTAYFHNAGTLRKSAKSGITSFDIPIINSGLVMGLQGTLSFGGGGILAGTFAAATNATINFSGGNFTNSGPVSMIGPGTFELSANAGLILLADAIPNLPLVGGTVHLGPAFQGGTITNLTLSGATLTGTNTVTGTFNWNNGTIAGGPLTIASNAVMNINAVNTLYLENPLTNWGTVTWTNTGFLGDLDVLNNNGVPYAGLIENLPGALFDIQCDHVLFNNAGAAAYFHNAGTLRKSANSGTTQFDIPIINSGLVMGLQGTLSFGGGGILAGTFADATNATINFSVGSFTNSGPVSIDGPGPIQLTGGILWLLTDEISNLPLTGGTVNLGPNFQQNGAITNLTIAGATLAGTNIVTGTFNWNNGTIAGGPLTIDSNGVMNINASTTLYLENPLTNWGTVTWTNTGFLGDLDVLNNNGLPYAGLIENLPGALFDIQCDHSLFNNAGSTAYFHNLGTLQKSAKSGTTGISLPVTNSGTIASLKGNLSFSGGFTPVGGALLFGLSNSNSLGVMSISGNATLGGTVGVLWLNGFVPASGNSFTVLNYGSYTGIFTNVTVPPSAAVWLTNYGPTSFTMSVASINKLGFTTQPVGGKLTNIIIAPVIVQLEDPSNNPVTISGVPITVSVNSGAGIINGTLTQSTDLTGKSTFSDLSFSAIGPKTLRATSSGLTTAISVPFQIVPLIGLQWTATGFLVQLNGTNSLAPVIIYASTNLSSWIPIYTNAPTNGPIQFLDTSATNYRARFYHTSEY